MYTTAYIQAVLQKYHVRFEERSIGSGQKIDRKYRAVRRADRIIVRLHVC
jgi:hypothetical protein